MKPDQLLSILVTVLVAFVGWCVGYWGTVRRDRLLKRRDLRTQYLIEAYRRLESAGNRASPSAEGVNALESAVADIQLFGSLGQVALARRFALNFAAHGQASLDELLDSLRKDLRAELKLGVVLERITYLRINPTN